VLKISAGLVVCMNMIQPIPFAVVGVSLSEPPTSHRKNRCIICPSLSLFIVSHVQVPIWMVILAVHEVYVELFY